MRRRIIVTALLAFALSGLLFVALSTTHGTLVSLIEAVFGFAVSASTIFAAWFAYEQLKLARDEAIERGKKPGLVFSPTAHEIPVIGGGVGISPWARHGTPQFKYRFAVYVINKGPGRTSSFHLSIFIPRPCLFDNETPVGLPRMNFNRIQQFNGTEYVERVLDVDRAIQPGTSAFITELFIFADPQSPRPPTLWQIRHGEDVFPRPDEHSIDGYGQISIALVNALTGVPLPGDSIIT